MARVALHMARATRNSKLSCPGLLLLGMDQNKTALERAFELARSGDYPSVEHIRRKIRGEGYLQDQLTGSALRRQLKELIAAATRSA
jgi:hypothetical protein